MSVAFRRWSANECRQIKSSQTLLHQTRKTNSLPTFSYRDNRFYYNIKIVFVNTIYFFARLYRYKTFRFIDDKTEWSLRNRCRSSRVIASDKSQRLTNATTASKRLHKTKRTFRETLKNQGNIGTFNTMMIT